MSKNHIIQAWVNDNSKQQSISIQRKDKISVYRNLSLLRFNWVIDKLWNSDFTQYFENANGDFLFTFYSS